MLLMTILNSLRIQSFYNHPLYNSSQILVVTSIVTIKYFLLLYRCSMDTLFTDLFELIINLEEPYMVHSCECCSADLHRDMVCGTLHIICFCP